MKVTYTKYNDAAPPIKVPLSQVARPKAETQEHFEARTEIEFTQTSAIAEGLYRTAIEFHADVEPEAGGETVTPIHEALGWRYSRFGYQARDPFYGAFFQQEDGATWQVKISSPPKDSKGYYAPKGDCGAYTPPIDAITWLKVCLRNQTPLPQELQQWLNDLGLSLILKRLACEIVSSKIGISSADPLTLSTCSNPEPLPTSDELPAGSATITPITTSASANLQTQIWRRLQSANRPIPGFWNWAERNRGIQITYPEGGKKALALLSRGHVAIALYGVNAGYRSTGLPTPELIADVRRFAQPGRAITLAFDADAKAKTVSRVRGALQAFGSLLTQAGCSVRVATWQHEQGKGIDDLIVISGGEVADLILAQAQTFSSWVKQREKGREATQHWLAQVLGKLDVAVDWSQEPDKNKAIRQGRAMVASQAIARNALNGEVEAGFFPAIELADGNRVLYALNGQKGTGKSSSAIKSVVDECKRSMRSAAIFAPTRLLCASLAAVLGVPTIYEDGRAPIVTLCPESAWKLKGRDFTLVVADEANEVLQRLAEGNLGNEPQLCREQFQRVLRGAKTIALAQDGLSRHSVATVARLAGIAPEEIQTISRRRRVSPIQIKLYADRGIGRTDEGQKQPVNGAKFTWFSSLIAALEAGQRVAIPCGSQKAARELSRLLRSYFGQNKRIRVHDGRDSFQLSKTEFCQNPDRWLEANQIDVLIFTPCFNSGVSIESEYFDVQYEYATPFETAESISQRGERVRDAIWGNRIQARHVYLSYRGLAAHPDPVIFTPQYWAELLHGDALGSLHQAEAVAEAVGARAVLESLKLKELARLERWSELPEILAYQAYQVYFKREFLQQEWCGNGWSVEAIPSLPDEVLKPLREGWRVAKEDLISQRARTLAKCRNYENIDPDCEETSGPIERTRLEKKKLALKTGQYEGIDDAPWLESWAVAPGNSGINPIRVQALLKLAMNEPEQFQALQTWQASRIIGSAATLKALPPTIPFTEREIDSVALLLQIEGVKAVARGDLTQWDKNHPLVQDAAEFARIHAAEFARLTKHSQRIHGLQFTSEISDVNCFHKILKMVGLSTKRCCMKRRVHQYRLEITADIAERIAKAMEQYRPIENLSRKAYQLDTRDEFCEHLENYFLTRIRALSPEWDAYVQKITAEVVSATGSASQIEGLDRSTEMLIRPDTPPWLQLSALIRGVKDWADIEKIAGLFPTEVKQRVWDALGKADREFRQSILRMKPT